MTQEPPNEKLFIGHFRNRARCQYAAVDRMSGLGSVAQQEPRVCQSPSPRCQQPRAARHAALLDAPRGELLQPPPPASSCRPACVASGQVQVQGSLRRLSVGRQPSSNSV